MLQNHAFTTKETYVELVDVVDVVELKLFESQNHVSIGKHERYLVELLLVDELKSENSFHFSLSRCNSRTYLEVDDVEVVDVDDVELVDVLSQIQFNLFIKKLCFLLTLMLL